MLTDEEDEWQVMAIPHKPSYKAIFSLQKGMVL